ncbi:cAMP-binding domain of CRP or a regulatory subunit of cAMP-dependent protein kinases [Mucilaginibacter gossypiicola]|uniref:cAMP-binding domain of CRP or a regulatory subunit of cAMP-dependent protein kinases n=1 Tax=Mucilaginibacter gossypiicola TaxID=551995 RepID=A0A1H7ZV40_9SPHI|nr:Crp/Fnr family transcriptional regulator [Mucilaginibacter gossypiicola]SEM62126.1 cAMP-binding domain of CRP or a regulatory subunit of cAMP-dependent protein kinases [Mucilaginibacter gossypiicola]
MLSFDDIEFYLRVFKELSYSDILELSQLSESRLLKAGEVYIAEGSSTHKLAYIKKGVIRSYFLKENGDEVTFMIRWENQFIASIDNIIHQKASRFTYQALEDTTLLEVDYKKAQLVVDDNPRLSNLRSTLLLHMLSQAMDRLEAFVILSPEERYIKLVQEKPDIVNRVADKYLATLLGITPVSLSRIRKRIAIAR